MGLPCSRMTSSTTLKACMVASLSDILSLVRTAVLTEKLRSATAFPCEIVREAFAKRERCGNILQPVTSVTFDTLAALFYSSVDFTDASH